MADSSMLRGLTTVNFYAENMKAASDWYTQLFGVEAYFVREYIEYRIGDYQHEFGLLHRKHMPQGAATTPGGAIIFLYVADIEAAVDRLKALGATEYEPIIKRGEGFITASVVDPLGNMLGVMYNEHYLDILKTMKGNASY